MANDDVRAQIYDAFYSMLIDKVRDDPYPSISMMNLIEAGIDEEHLGAYADVLLNKVTTDRYPSMDMLVRLSRMS